MNKMENMEKNIIERMVLIFKYPNKCIFVSANHLMINVFTVITISILRIYILIIDYHICLQVLEYWRKDDYTCRGIAGNKATSLCVESHRIASRRVASPRIKPRSTLYLRPYSIVCVAPYV